MALLLLVFGFIAGTIDSIAGGGGLITVPIFTLMLGPGASAIGTNKIVAAVSTSVALMIYRRHGHVTLRGNRRFALLAAVGAIAGAYVSPRIPPLAYKWLIVAIVPAVLYIVLAKDIWARELKSETKLDPRWLWLAGLACGFYDGVAGPGGGTLMFLSLFVVARLPLLTAMGTAKVANFATASTSLAAFASQGHVIWNKGVMVAVGIGVGAALGAWLATKNAARWARAALAIVSLLLLLRLIAL